MRFVSPPTALTLAGLAFLATSCTRDKPGVALKADQVLDTMLFPTTLAENLRAAGGGHFRATTRLRADVAAPAADEASSPAAPAEVTTTTDLWVDRQGSFRLLEENNQDGGREIVRVGGEVAVALRYGKMVRRPERDAENERFLAEALGGPWAAWELVRRQVAIKEAGRDGLRFELAARATALPAGFPPPQGLRKWRETAQVKSLTGQATLDTAGRLPLAFACKAGFLATRENLPIAGEIEVNATLTELGQVAQLAMPDAGTLPVRQRTVLEERALLGALPPAGSAGPRRQAP